MPRCRCTSWLTERASFSARSGAGKLHQFLVRRVQRAEPPGDTSSAPAGSKTKNAQTASITASPRSAACSHYDFPFVFAAFTPGSGGLGGPAAGRLSGAAIRRLTSRRRAGPAAGSSGRRGARQHLQRAIGRRARDGIRDLAPLAAQ